MMKIALVNAGLPENSCECLRATAYPPLSIVYLATYLKRKIPSIDILLIDNQITKNIPLDKIADCDFIGISANSLTYPKAIEIAKSIKVINKHVPVILGGIHASILPDQIFDNQQCFDYLVRGQGEIALYKFALGVSKSEIPNLVYREINGKLIFNKQNFIPINDTPFPDFSLIDTNSYFENFSDRYRNKTKYKGIAFISSTGCRWKSKTGGCSFCSIPNSPLSCLTPTQFWDNILYIKNTTGADFFWDVSDTFTSNKEWITSVACSKPSNADSRFHIYGRVNDLIQDGVINNLKRIGIEEMLIGVESFDDEILKHNNKGITVSQIFSVLNQLESANIKVALSLILGLPGENTLSIKKSVALCKEIKEKYTIICECHPSIITPLPGSPIYNSLIQIPSVFEKYNGLDFIPINRIQKDFIHYFTECSYEQIAEAYLSIDKMFPSAGPFYMEKNDPLYNSIGYIGSV